MNEAYESPSWWSLNIELQNPENPMNAVNILFRKMPVHDTLHIIWGPRSSLPWD